MKANENNLVYNFENGTFSLKNPENSSYLYFPLANTNNMISSITPLLGGDIKSSQNTFLLTPTSSEDLHTLRSSRNFWVYIDKKGPWSATGNSVTQISKLYSKEKEETSLECGFLWHKVTRISKDLNIKSEIINFVPVNEDKVELMKVKLINLSDKDIFITATSAIPIYGRSADNLRDHRHVTSLLNRINTNTYGVNVNPTLTFDERGHKKNEISYLIIGSEANGNPPIGFFPDVEGFLGEGGTYDWPRSIVNNDPPTHISNQTVDGYEAVGAIRFEKVLLKPNESKTYIVAMIINENHDTDYFDQNYFAQNYLSEEKFDILLKENKIHWENELGKLKFSSADKRFDSWSKWVTIQPILRRIYGCSFLPHHDYGRGGRGWRDLWQDCLALILMDSKNVRDLLKNNFSGVRIDGSNATIIGSKPGEFLADRNNIPRVWMDHGAWPFITTKLYIDQTGDLDFLFDNQTYFKDKLANRCSTVDEKWSLDEGTKLKTIHSKIYNGTILEHLLIQNLTVFFNVGEHNNIKLEGADWNDAFDMATHKGESVAFTAFYGSNLIELSKLLIEIKSRKKINNIEIATEVLLLLNIRNEIDYNSIEKKRNQLNKYFSAVKYTVAGEKSNVNIEELSKDLKEKGVCLLKNIEENEWIKNKEGFKWFNGYYDDCGEKLEGDFSSGVRMTLTGQVFPIMSKYFPREKVQEIIKTSNKYLRDEKVGGFRLNTDFKELKLNMGRAFGFAFGHKENGSMFSHMAIMYSNSLYKNNFVREGYDVISMIYNHCNDFEKSRIYPGIPEYINEKGRGVYNYLTGSASWLLLTLLNEVYGVKWDFGDLMLEPKLVREQFDENNEAKVQTFFQNRSLEVVYKNSNNLDFGEYSITSVKINECLIDVTINKNYVLISKNIIDSLGCSSIHQIAVELL
ncbi:GH36-type glycosyl hydrolase domain-containing protein [Clostridium lacusfryxellense]|uniref:GH36-type glycosyl hydrolase domain-containing protein n=1 Tax=Clostridium lacusfryxellense TaxID=205328 RepID=UPI001C0E143E|nr:cellobiose phosphorylase [Clostridium lacusfryxellense]MBU3111248.1 cellobiose phosphorylase [Clostridium lacusfryxellense]